MTRTMSNNDLAIVILAAGKGTRLKSSLAKVLHRAGGRTLVEQIVRACEPLKARETVVVVGHQAEQVAAVVAPRGALTVLQRPQNGTGHAVQVAKRTLGRPSLGWVLPGHLPPHPREALRPRAPRGLPGTPGPRLLPPRCAVPPASAAPPPTPSRP